MLEYGKINYNCHSFGNHNGCRNGSSRKYHSTTSISRQGCPTGEDAIKQGGLGEFYSKQGKDYYYGVGGHEFGQVRSGFAKSSPNLIGANTAFYGSGECHSDKHPEVCQ